MAKKRVYELARELEISSKEFIERANALGYTWIQSHANSLEDGDVIELRRKIAQGGGQPKPKKKTVLRRRAVRSQSPSDPNGKEEYQVIVTRLSDAGETVIERKRIEVPVPSIMSQTFSISEPTSGEEVSPTPAHAQEVVSSPQAQVGAGGESVAAPSGVTAAAVEEPNRREEASSPSTATQNPSPATTQAAIEEPKTVSAAEVASTPVDATTDTAPVDPPKVNQTAEVKAPAAPQASDAVSVDEPNVTKSAAPEELVSSVSNPAPAKEAETVAESTMGEPSIEPPQPKAADASNKRAASKEKKSSPASSNKKQDEKIVPDLQIGSKFKEEIKPELLENAETERLNKTIDSDDYDSIAAAEELPAETLIPENQIKQLHQQTKRQNEAVPPRRPQDEGRGRDKRKKKQQQQQQQQQMQGERKSPGRRVHENPTAQQGKKRGKNKKKRGRDRNEAKPVGTLPPSEKKRVVKVDEAITLSGLAHEMGIKASELIRTLMKNGFLATINQTLSVEEATDLAKEFGYDVQDVGFSEQELIKSTTIEIEEEPEELLEARPPVITVMGHVDHGKTSLLDAIRSTDVAAGEAGGITQHIGAYTVKHKELGSLTFLDTPGHEAFTSMRSRGAQATDIVILVVAADDGVMPQTIEAISHAKAAKTPIVVAVNKIDKDGSDPMRVRYDLMQHDLIDEELGGDIQMVNVSAHTREGLDDLLERVLLQAEIMELKANPNKPASGIVIESVFEEGRGAVATLLVAEGTLKAGDTIVAGTHFGRIRAMEDDKQNRSKEAGPSFPVKVLGLSGAPVPGDRFDSVADGKAAKQVIENRIRLENQKAAEVARPAFDGWGGAEQKDLNLIIKADTQGTLEAIRQSLGQLKHDEINVKVTHAAVGGITENDVNLASTTGSIILGFHVRADNKAQRTAESEGVEYRIFRVIYELIDNVKMMMEKQLTPVLHEKPIGQAEIRKTFNIPKAGRVAGCYVTEGKITRGALIRLFREDIQIYEGKVATLRRFKDDVKEVATGYECGIQIEGYQDIRTDDVIEAYEIEEVAPKLELS